MTARDRLPPRRTSRSIHPALAVLLAAVVGVVVATGVSPVVRADPDPSTVGPWLEVAPASGRVTDPFTASYWYISGDGTCAYATVDFSWDDDPVATTTVDQVACKATYTFPAPPTPELGVHTISAVACFVDPTGGTQCVGFDSVDYFIDPTPTLLLSPDLGTALQPFSATYASNGTNCPYDSAEFSWDGAAIGSPIPLDTSCGATLLLDAPPLPNGVGDHVVSAMACDGSVCDSLTIAEATYTIAPDLGPPTLVLDPNTGTEDAPFTATYTNHDPRCPFVGVDVEFEWDGTPISPRVLMDIPTCSAVLGLPAVPSPAGPGTYVMTAVACPDNCEPATLAQATYVVTPPVPPTLAVTPGSGTADAAFTATYSTNQTTCSFATAQFEWDGQPIGLPVPLDSGCTAALDVPGAPLPTAVGLHELTAVACATVCDAATLATTTYEVLAPTPPSLVVAPTSGTAATPFSATYATNGGTCAYTHAVFTWDGAAIGTPIDLDVTCHAVLTLTSAPSPNRAGAP